MKRRKVTEIIVETDEVFVYSSDAPAPRLCASCGVEVMMATPESIATLGRISKRAVYRLIEANVVHFEETPEGTLLMCLPSFTESTREVD
jgi:hypothetical protein